jgi:hypothetical protein
VEAELLAQCGDALAQGRMVNEDPVRPAQSAARGRDSVVNRLPSRLEMLA